MNIEAGDQVAALLNDPNTNLAKTPTPRWDPSEEEEKKFYGEYLIGIQKFPQPNFVLGWDVFEDFKLEMEEFPEVMLKDWVLKVAPVVKKTLIRSKKFGYQAQDGTHIYTVLLDVLNDLSYKYWKELPTSFRPRLEVNFGVQEPEDGNEKDEEDEECDDDYYIDPIVDEDFHNFQKLAPKNNVVLCFGDLDSPSKSIFKDLHSGFVMKFMDKDCLFETQVSILNAYLQILSQAEKKHNVYYGSLINFDSRTFFKYNRDEATIFQSETFKMNLEELYINQNWNENESQFYRLLGAICWKLLKESARNLLEELNQELSFPKGEKG